jgi:hypothetical protein
MNILEALDDPNVFKKAFKGSSWDAWRVFLATLFALPLTEDQLTVFQKHTGRTAAPTKAFTEAALVVGRRGGKSRALALTATYLATFRDYTAFLGPGEVATVAIIASDRKQARSIFRFILGMLKEVPMLKGLILEETADTIVLSNRVTIEIATASFRVTRGYTFAAVLADETAFWRDESYANPDTEIFRALRPGMLSIPGSILLNASSPYRRAGLLWTTYQKNFGKDDARVLVWQASTAEMNPKVNPEIIAEAYEEDPESAASEFGGDFRNDIADFVSRQIVEALIEPGCFERAPLRSLGYRYFCFIDAAGGSGQDSMTLAIAHVENGLQVLDCVREVKPRFSPDAVVLEFPNLMRSYGVTRAQSDRWGGDWVLKDFLKQGVTVTPSAKAKADLYRELLPLLNAGRCTLLDHPRLVSQLCALERRVGRSGKDAIDHPVNGHDDVANAVAGALLLASVRPALIITDQMMAMSRKPMRPGMPMNAIPGTGWQVG